jgi:hypothetical protein
VLDLTETVELGRSRFDKVLLFLKESRKIFYGVIVFIAIFGIGWLNIDIPYISPFVGSRRFFFSGLIVGVFILYIPSKMLVSRFYTVDSDIIFEVNEMPENDNAKIRRYEVGEEKLNRMTVNGKKPISWRSFRGKTAYMVRKCDLENEELITTHHAEMSDLELMAYRENVKKARIRIRKQALKGIKLFSRFETIIEDIEQALWTKKTKNYIDVATQHKKEVEQAVEQSVPDYIDDDNKDQSIDDLINSFDADIESVTIGNGKGVKSNEKQQSGNSDE